MLDETTELQLESVWQSMSEGLQKDVIAAVDQSLMGEDQNDQIVVLKGLDEEKSLEIEHIIASGISEDEPAFKPVPAGRHVAPTEPVEDLGEHDARLDESPGSGYRMSGPMRDYVIQRILL